MGLANVDEGEEQDHGQAEIERDQEVLVNGLLSSQGSAAPAEFGAGEELAKYICARLPARHPKARVPLGVPPCFVRATLALPFLSLCCGGRVVDAAPSQRPCPPG